MSNASLWLAFGLGAYHGINPGMGWLFAVALGMQEKKRSAVFRALPPIAIGHALSVGIVLAILALAEFSLPELAVKIGAAAFLVSFGLLKIVRARHPTWSSMRVGFVQLTLWSFLMASAHGAGLMLVPVVLGSQPEAMPIPSEHAHHADMMMEPGPADSEAESTADAPRKIHWLARVALLVVHTAGHLLVAAILAIAIYEWVGLAILRTAWVNLDLIWAGVLILSGAIILIL